MRSAWMLQLAAGLGIQGFAHAKQIRLLSYDEDDRGGLVELASDVPIGEPWLRVDGHSVRVWFPQVEDIARFDHERDANDPIRALFLRPGASDTAVLRIELGASRKIKPSDVEVTRNGQHASVRVRVPSLKPEPAPVPAAAPAMPLAIQRVAQPAAAPQPVAAEKVELEPGPFDVVLSPSAVSELLEWMAMASFSARPFLDGMSLLCGRQGELVCDPRITIVDDAGHDHPGAAPCPF